jgi:hypothetical protein
MIEPLEGLFGVRCADGDVLQQINQQSLISLDIVPRLGY